MELLGLVFSLLIILKESSSVRVTLVDGKDEVWKYLWSGDNMLLLCFSARTLHIVGSSKHKWIHWNFDRTVQTVLYDDNTQRRVHPRAYVSGSFRGLYMDNMQKEWSGYYECHGYNRNDRPQTDSARYVVTVRNSFQVVPGPKVIVRIGETATLTCDVTIRYAKRASRVWMRDWYLFIQEVYMQEDSEYAKRLSASHSNGKMSLTIRNVTPFEDSGYYACGLHGGSDFDNIEDYVLLTVDQEFDKVKVIATNASAIVGQDATLNCKLTLPGDSTSGVFLYWKLKIKYLTYNNKIWQGDPKKYSASVNNREMNLTIRDVTLEDAQVYTCVVYDRNGFHENIVVPVQLTVIPMLDKSVISGTNLTILWGQVALMKCKLAIPDYATKLVSRVWKDGSKYLFVNDDGIEQSDSMSVFATRDEMTLKIKETVLEDEKKYTCALYGAAVPVYSAVYLTVNLWIHESAIHGKDVTVLWGETATLTCKVSIPDYAKNHVALVWKDGLKNLAMYDHIWSGDSRMSASFSSSEMTLKIRGITLKDEKKYTCGVIGSKLDPPIHKPVFLTVKRNISKVVAQFPPGHYIIETLRALFQCSEETPTGIPTPKFRWYKDGKLLRAMHLQSSTIYYPNNGTLFIYKVSSQNFGKYQCEAYNKYESKWSQSVDIKPVWPLVTTTCHFPKYKIIVPGRTAEFTCRNTVPKNFPTNIPFVYRWFKGPSYKELPTNSKDKNEFAKSNFSIDTKSGTLTFHKVTKHDFGIYRCDKLFQFQGESYNVRCDGTHIQAPIPPANLSCEFPLVREEYFDIHHPVSIFKCHQKTEKAVPRALYKWYRNDEELPTSSASDLKYSKSKFSYDYDTGSLVFKGLSTANEGVYRCVADNGADETTECKSPSVILPAPPSPAICEFPVGYAMGIGVNYTFRCSESEPTGVPKPQIYWMKEDWLGVTELMKEKSEPDSLKPGWSYTSNRRTGTLAFTNVNYSDSGMYSCKIVNFEGESHCKERIIVTRESRVVLSGGRSLSPWIITNAFLVVCMSMLFS